MRQIRTLLKRGSVSHNKWGISKGKNIHPNEAINQMFEVAENLERSGKELEQE